MSILSLYERFAFAVLSCPIGEAREVILAQSATWNRPLAIDRETARDVRPILNSPDGPAQLPALRKAILLSEVDGPDGQKTLFVSSVADGYSSMIYMVSKRVAGLHVAVQVSSLSCEYPRNALTAIAGEKEARVVYAMRDTNAWDFFEKGDPLPFEDLSYYRARQRRDRLTPEIISEYLARFGYGSLDKDFWISAESAHLLCEREFRLSGEVLQ
jgi:hypothetical protein